MAESQQSMSLIIENSEPNSICFKSDSTEASTDTSDNIESRSDIGITNKAFVGEDELDVKKSKPQQSSSSRVEDIVISSGTYGEKDSKLELADLSPCIITDVSTKNGKTEEQYREYFIPVNEHKKSFRGEKLYTKTKEQGIKNRGKLCCWIFSLALLAGAITVAVLIGIGIINIDPVRQVKESHNPEIETANIEEIHTPKLLEVPNTHGPIVLTNNLAFFLSEESNKDHLNDIETDLEFELDTESKVDTESNSKVEPESEVERESEVEPESEVGPESEMELVSEVELESDLAFLSEIKLCHVSENESEHEPDTRKYNSVPDTYLEFKLEIIREPKTERTTDTGYEIMIEHDIHVNVDNDLPESETTSFEDVSHNDENVNQSDLISEDDRVFEAEGSAESDITPDTNIAQDAYMLGNLSEGSSDFLHNMHDALGGDEDNGSGEKEDAVSDSNISTAKDTFQEMLKNGSLEVNDKELDILESSKIDAFKREPLNSIDVMEIHESFPSVSDIITGHFLTGPSNDEKNEVEEGSG